MAKLRRKHLKPVMSTLEDALSQDNATRMDLGRIMDTLADHGIVLSRLERDLGAKRTLQADLDRIETLMGGVKAALERIGGTSLPSAVQDIAVLRQQISGFGRALQDHHDTLIKLYDVLSHGAAMKPKREPKAWSKAYATDPEPKPKREPKAWSKAYPDPKPKRTYNRRKKDAKEDQVQVEISRVDAAPHNGAPGVEEPA